MYEIRVNLFSGINQNFYGAPDLDLAYDTPTTGDITVGELPIDEGDEMKFLFDYGHRWDFNIKLESIGKIASQDDEISQSLILRKKGDAPEQYPEW